MKSSPLDLNGTLSVVDGDFTIDLAYQLARSFRGRECPNHRGRRSEVKLSIWLIRIDFVQNRDDAFIHAMVKKNKIK